MEEARKTDGMGIKPLLRVLDREREAVPPVWLMRQAGRYLPEYRAVREKAGGFLDLCFNPKLAAEVTLQPVRRFGFDAAILFSDILVIPLALGRKVEFQVGEGPRLEPLADAAALGRMRETVDGKVLAPIYETVAQVKSALDNKTALIGFCGAPWTVATYMVAGEATPDQAPARLFAYRDPENFQKLIDRLVQGLGRLSGWVSSRLAPRLCRSSIPGRAYCHRSNSSAGASSRPRRSLPACAQQVPGTKIIGFPRGAGMMALPYVERTGVNAIGLDWTFDRKTARELLQPRVPVQGNVDPLALLAGGAALDREVDDVMAALSGGPFIFNLGHGILPETPIAHVEHMLKRVRGR